VSLEAAPVQLRARDGYALFGTVYAPSPDVTNPPTVVIASATAVRRRYYDAFARFLAARGFRVLTFDYRGIGDSRPPRLRGFRAEMHEWGELDLSAVVDWAHEQFPAAPLLLVGHSVGGQLVGFLDHVDTVQAVLSVGAQSGYWRHWPRGPKAARMAVNWYLLIPTVARVFGYVPGFLGIGEDLPAGVALEWAAWGRRPHYLFDGFPERAARFARYGGPWRSYSISDDPYAPRAAVGALLAFYTGAQVEHVHVTPAELGVTAVGHFGFFRERFRESLWTDAAQWLVERAGCREAACYPAAKRAEAFS
jgi:predicted alpha/beta hydrolase